MPDPKAWRLPEPENDADFEVLCLDLFKAYKRPSVEPERFGRNGQAQHGVDFALDVVPGLEAYQCKCQRNLTFEDIAKEVAKTSSFPARMLSFTVLTTAPRDSKVQSEVYGLSRRRQDEGEFPVGVVFWESLCDLLAEHMEVLRAHFPHLAPDLIDLLKGRAERVARELPGTSLMYVTGQGRTAITIKSAERPLPVTPHFLSADAQARFDEAMRTGRAATFDGGELDLTFPPAIEHVLGRRPVGPGD